MTLCAQNSPAPAQPSVSRDLPKVPNYEYAYRDNSLSEQQHKAINLLLSGKHYGEVAREVGVDRRTLYNWRHSANFSAAMKRFRRQLWQVAADHLRALVHPALAALRQELLSRHDSKRFRAAVAILRASDIRRTAPVREDDDENDGGLEEVCDGDRAAQR